MAFSNAFVEIRMGNVESKLLGPAPRQRLDQALNPHLASFPTSSRAGRTSNPPMVYRPARGTFLSGALPEVKRVLRRAGVRFRVRDFRWTAQREGSWSLHGLTLRDYQRDVVNTALQAGHGLIDLGTGGGKTLLAAAILARLGLPTLYLVTTRTLLDQAVRNLAEYLGTEPGVIGQGVRDPQLLTVALIQSLDAGDTDLDRWRGGTLVFDEGHHAAAGTYQDLIRRVDPRYHFYLSAVPFRSGRDQAVLTALAGQRLTGGKYSARFLIEKGYACPVHVRAERCVISQDMSERPFATIYREFIVLNPERNRRVAALAREASRAGRSVLVLVEHVRHGEELRLRLGTEAVFVHGATSRRVLQRATGDFTSGSLRCLIATSGLFQEGVSISGIQTLVQAGGLRSRAKVIQTVGRGMRVAPGKKSCTYVDFWDDDSAGVLRRHARERFRVLKEEGFFIPPLEDGLASAGAEDEIEPHWAHVPATDRFVLVDGAGRISAKARCLRRGLVPKEVCKKCRLPVCETGGRIVWRDK